MTWLRFRKSACKARCCANVNDSKLGPWYTVLPSTRLYGHPSQHCDSSCPACPAAPSANPFQLCQGITASLTPAWLHLHKAQRQRQDGSMPSVARACVNVSMHFTMLHAVSAACMV